MLKGRPWTEKKVWRENWKRDRSKYKSWTAAQRLLLRQEKERYEAEQAKLERELQQLRNPVEAEEEDMEAELEEHGESGLHLAMEERMLQAERMAYDAQQSMMAMQCNFQTMMGQMMNQIQQVGLAAQPPMATSPTRPLGPTLAPSPSMLTKPGGSPQMPKMKTPQVGKHATQAALKTTVAKGHLKKDGKEKDKANGGKPRETPTDAPKSEEAAVTQIDDEPNDIEETIEVSDTEKDLL